MKTIVEINSCNFASTGNIMLGIAETAKGEGYRVITFNPHGNSQKRGIKDNKFIGNHFERQLSLRINYFTGKQGSLNYIGTKLFLKSLDKLQPHILHFHNLHSNYINFEMLFDYINKHNINVVWTLHDCWAFTGHCPYFDIVQCNKWKEQCYDCPMIHEYPETYRDTSISEYRRKQRLFTSVKSMTIVTPSNWLANHVSESFLKKYPVRIIYNGIDLEKFCPRESNFREQYHLEDKFIILGVAFSWGERKGLDRFIKLAGKLDRRFQIVLVGINQHKIGTDRIVCIEKTDSQERLSEIYTVADVFLNPTREDNFPTVNIEALACGTPVLSYGAGGSAEAFDKNSGMIISDDSVLQTLDKLYYKNFDTRLCIERGKHFEQKSKFKEYVKLYDKILDT